MKVPENDDPISASKLLLVSLLDQIENIINFKGKWGLIKSKLLGLQSQLVDLSDFPSSLCDPLAIDLIRSVFLTLNDAVSLSRKCQNDGLTEGKLKTQSELDAVLAKLNRHVMDSEILIRSGVLQDGAVSSSSSKKEAVRIESRNLITRLQIGTNESKNSAMDSLLGLLQEDDKNVMIAVAQGVVPVLVRLLDSSSLEMKDKTVAAISRVSMVESSKHVLIAEGLLLLNHLLRVLESGSGFAKEKSCIALQALTFSKENARAIGSREALVADGFIARLVSALNCGVLNVRIAAAKAVYELGFSLKTRKEMGECGCIAPLIKMLDGKAVEEKEAGAMALSKLVLYVGNRKVFQKDERGIVNVVQLLDPLIQNLDKKYPVSILSELLHSKRCRKQMIAAGACVHLQKLVEVNIDGAKKLLESLGKGKIWGVFARP
ncbi:hypothetical protein ES319_A07G054500v1 [Gossypium barbadense]|uniref:DUF7032 domain-containing protein n=1 Tax=Gossypium barbadense TaxID=3634 RepID=A0A5J5UZL8_GOSBA|nr:hypothetical protein ES319_A07G054500v1 [Gossypium barbadense]KAB2072995.1 hypothetical protein ES319_A07G054500v1 [Gossypium barbadense]